MKLNEIKLLESKLITDPIKVKTRIEELIRCCVFSTMNSPKVNHDGTVDTNGYVDFENFSVSVGADYSIDIKFGNVGEFFDCSKNQLTDIDFAPTKCDSFLASRNRLTNTDNLPICDMIDVSYNQITSIQGIPAKLTELCIDNNPIYSLVGIADHLIMSGAAHLTMSFEQIKEGGIGLILVAGLSIIRQKTTSTANKIYLGTQALPGPFKIITKYLGRPDDIFECQTELIESGYAEYAQI